uniref:Reverse transcriptase domain-containing protein n=1 Tax=Mola mola TaxID=94237 RepID=A0A3Q3XJ42_MOLML
LAADSDSASVLLLLDLSAAFDTVNHCIVLDRLQNYFGISGQMLKWLGSYLSGRSLCVLHSNTFSKSCYVRYGVQQGFGHSPLLLSMYLAPCGQIMHSFGIAFHCYADDLQPNMQIVSISRSDQAKPEACPAALRSWLLSNFLLLNSAKTDITAIRPVISMITLFCLSIIVLFIAGKG